MTDEKRYDRQLRLWGEESQHRLEATKVLSIGSDCLASEFLKSIILPGIGFITIADDHKIDEIDLQTNFFVEIEDIGKLRSEVILNNLLELNDRVKGEFVSKNIDEIMKEKEYLQEFQIIACLNQNHNKVIELTKMTDNIVIEAYTNGYLGFVKAYYKTHVIFDDGKLQSGQTFTFVDLRLRNPFPSLKEYLDSFDFSSMEEEKKMHLPYPIILYHILKEWRKQIGDENALPTFKNKNELLKIMRKYEINTFNFQEARGNLNKIYRTIESEIRLCTEFITKETRSNNNLKGLRKDDIEFWTFIYAVQQFFKKNNRLPIQGKIGDMQSGNKEFLEFQKIYNDQLEEDAKEILMFCEEKLEKDDIKDVVKFNLDMVKGHIKTLFYMKVLDTPKDDKYKWEYQPNDVSLINFTAAIYACFKFYELHGEYPCDSKDVEEMKGLTKEILVEKTGDETVFEGIYVEEICRFGNLKIHTVESVMGSFVAQEVIKFTCHKYSSLCNTFIFDAQSGQSLHGFY